MSSAVTELPVSILCCMKMTWGFANSGDWGRARLKTVVRIYAWRKMHSLDLKAAEELKKLSFNLERMNIG